MTVARTADVLSPLQVAKFFVKEGKEGDENMGAHAIYAGIDSNPRTEDGTILLQTRSTPK